MAGLRGGDRWRAGAVALLCAGALVVADAASTRKAHGLLSRTRSEKAGAETAANDYPHRRHLQQIQDNLSMMQGIRSGEINALTDVLPGLAKDVTDDEAKTIFENFPIFTTTSTYKNFQQSGSTDETDSATAMKESVKEFMGLLGVFSSPDNFHKQMQEFITSGDEGVQKLAKALKKGDATAMAKLQQAFSDKHLGGLDLSKMQDNTWVAKAQNDLFSNEDITRVMGGAQSTILPILANPNLRHKDGADVSADGIVEGLF